MAETRELTSPIQGVSCHAWNADRSLLAMCPNNNEVHIYETATWTRKYLLQEHDLLVSAMDWCPVHNKLVTCSHDRNAFVWTYEESGDLWRPSLVILRIDRAALDVKWSADGLRFAVASSDKCVPVCTYDPSSDWWVCNMIKKKLKSTVLCVAFHPTNSQLLAVGCADFKCRVFSTYNSSVDAAPNAAPFGAPVAFGEPYVEMSSQGWIHSVAWSPSGNVLAYSGHDSSVYIANIAGLIPEGKDPASVPETQMNVVRLSCLPLTEMLFLNETTLFATGHDMNPCLITCDAGNKWAFHSFVDREKKVEAAVQSSVSQARALFRSKTDRGENQRSGADNVKLSHDRLVSSLLPYTTTNGEVTAVSTTAFDGKLGIWKFDDLGINLASLRI